jgi:hypothetical protein
MKRKRRYLSLQASCQRINRAVSWTWKPKTLTLILSAFAAALGAPALATCCCCAAAAEEDVPVEGPVSDAVPGTFLVGMRLG